MGAFVGALIAALVLIPIELWQLHARHKRSLAPHELSLQRATHPLGGIAVLLFVFGFASIEDALTPLVVDPAVHWLSVAALAAVLLYGLASFITGASRSWGVRGDGMLPARAFIKLSAGVVGLLMISSETRAGVDDNSRALLLLVLGAISVWCAVTGAVRFVLLMGGGGGALGRVRRYIRQTQVVMRPARSRPWWRFW
jgi:hypothetical protein